MGDASVFIYDGGKVIDLILRHFGRAQGADETDFMGNEIAADATDDSYSLKGLNVLKYFLLGQAQFAGNGFIGPGFDRKFGLDAVQNSCGKRKSKNQGAF